MAFVSWNTAALVCLSAVLAYALFTHRPWKRHEQENKTTALDESTRNPLLSSSDTINIEMITQPHLRKIVSLPPEADPDGFLTHNGTDLEAKEGISQRISRLFAASYKSAQFGLRMVDDFGRLIASTALRLLLVGMLCAAYKVLRSYGIGRLVIACGVVAIVALAFFGGYGYLVTAAGRELFSLAVCIWKCAYFAATLLSVQNPATKSSSLETPVPNPFSVDRNLEAGRSNTQASSGMAEEEAPDSWGVTFLVVLALVTWRAFALYTVPVPGFGRPAGRPGRSRRRFAIE